MLREWFNSDMIRKIKVHQEQIIIQGFFLMALRLILMSSECTSSTQDIRENSTASQLMNLTGNIPLKKIVVSYENATMDVIFLLKIPLFVCSDSHAPLNSTVHKPITSQ